jgi:hypothetical protein
MIVAFLVGAVVGAAGGWVAGKTAATVASEQRRIAELLSDPAKLRAALPAAALADVQRLQEVLDWPAFKLPSATWQKLADLARQIGLPRTALELESRAVAAAPAPPLAIIPPKPRGR